MSYYLKDPASRIDYAIEWLPSLGGQAIAASQWIVAPAEAGGLAIEEERFDAARTAATIGGGVAGHVYSLSNRVTLSDGTIEERSITLRAEQR